MKENKMKIVQLNIVSRGSTGSIMLSINDKISELGLDSYCIYGRGYQINKHNCLKIGSNISFLFHAAISTLFDLHGFGSFFSTKKIIQRIKEIDPNIIHLHNIHGYYINYEVLFDYLNNEFKGKIVWTLHDCWSFTGHCAHFTEANCEKWKSQCFNCINKTEYPISYGLDLSRFQFKRKRQMFNQKNIELVVPSSWLKNLVQQSFLSSNKIHIIHNWVDCNIFKYDPDNTIFDKYNIPKKKIILGVASTWNHKKGLKSFLEISQRLSNDYSIVLVGLSKEQIRQLPSNIIGIKRTDNQSELAKLYSIADVFINPSKEETFSLVVLESLACGTRAIVMDSSATKELVIGNNGLVLHNNDTDSFVQAIYQLEKTPYDKDELITFAKNYDPEKQVKQYYDLYCSILESTD